MTWWDRLVNRVIYGPTGRPALHRQRAMLSHDEIQRRLRTWRESAEGQELEDMLIAAAQEEKPEAAYTPPVDAPLVTDKRGSWSDESVPASDRSSYMVADVEFDLERIKVEFTMPIVVAQELMGHVLAAEDYEEAQEMSNEFMQRLCDVMAKALFGQ